MIPTNSTNIDEQFIDTIQDGDEIIEMFGEKEARWYQIAARNQVEDILRYNPTARVLVNMPTGCHRKGTEILMFDGSVKPVEDIIVGDQIMGPDGESREVLVLHRGKQEMAEIIPTRGSSYVVNLDHILSLKAVNEGNSKWRQSPSHLKGTEIINISVRDWISKSKNFKRLYKQYKTNCLPFVQKNLPLDPYFLGVYLGDGGSSARSVHITNIDTPIIECIYQTASELNLSVRVETQPNTKACMYYFAGNGSKGGNELINKLKLLQLYQLKSDAKFIPFDYKTSSVDDRLQLLAGLLDTDGHYKNVFSYCTKSVQLANDVMFISQSLGFNVNSFIRTVNGQQYTDVTISGNLDRIPTRIKRKQATPRLQKKDVLKSGFSVHLLPEDEYFGFSINKDNLYVMGNFVVTHNCGKTLTSGLIFSSPSIRKSLKVKDGEKLRLLFFAHKHRLLTQAERTFADAVGVELITQSIFSEIPQNILDVGWHISCIDESHHEAARSVQYHLEQIGDHPIIGLTATPDRADGFLIKFDEIVNPISREQAVEEGWLASTNVHSFVDVSGKDKTEILSDIFENFAHEMGQTLVFVKTKKEVANLTLKLRKLGYKVVGLLNSSGTEVDFLLDQFSAGNIQFIVNCNYISEGVDVVGCDTIVGGRQFGSYAQLNQIIGRAARPDSDCNYWELVNPLSGTNLDATVIVGIPESHRLVWKQGDKWIQQEFDYVTHKTNKQFGITNSIQMGHRVEH